MIYLIKKKNIFSRFCEDIYIIQYQKHNFLYIHLQIFSNFASKYLKAFYIDKIIYIKLLTIETDLINKFTRIITLVILYSLCEKTHFYSIYIINI